MSSARCAVPRYGWVDGFPPGWFDVPEIQRRQEEVGGLIYFYAKRLTQLPNGEVDEYWHCLLYTSPSPRD